MLWKNKLTGLGLFSTGSFFMKEVGVMAGVGPAPKDPRRRARKNKEQAPLKLVEIEPSEQPDLPSFDIEIKVDGEIITQEFDWPEQTQRWWLMWAESPLSTDFTETDWDFLLDTARLHAAYWRGDLKLAGELRLRVAKFGATPEDRARLRIQFATADETEDKRDRRTAVGSASRSRIQSVRPKEKDAG